MSTDASIDILATNLDGMGFLIYSCMSHGIYAVFVMIWNNLTKPKGTLTCRCWKNGWKGNWAVPVCSVLLMHMVQGLAHAACPISGYSQF